MSFDFLKYKENQYLIPTTIPNKKQYYHDLMYIEQSFVGRMDALISNSFLQESVQLIINAINLFEMGYFDCSFYLLRQSLETSTTMVYLVDSNTPQKEEVLRRWKSGQDYFPMQKKMIESLKSNGGCFGDFRDKLNDYFSHMESVKKKLDKRVHKQGFGNFYVGRNHPFNRNKPRNRFVEVFEGYVKSCIGSIAVLRLAIDPFPILLNDEEIYHRTPDFLTEPYSDEFIEKYIGLPYIAKYKETDIYQDHFRHVMTAEKKKDCVTDVVKVQYIDTKRISEILEQKHLLNKCDLVAVLICQLFEKVVKVYTIGGFHCYRTDRKPVRNKESYDGRDFEKIRVSNPSCNIPYDEAFITHVALNNEDYYLEHNEPLSAEELGSIQMLCEPTPPSPVLT